MWEQLKPTHPTVILFAQYEDFATIEVEKKTNKDNSITHYMVNVNIIDITEQSVDIYKMDEVEAAIKKIREEIEELYDNIPLFSDQEVEEWIDSFCDLLSEF